MKSQRQQSESGIVRLLFALTFVQRISDDNGHDPEGIFRTRIHYLKKMEPMIKKLLLALPLCALIACGGGGEKANDEESGVVLPTAATVDFPKLHFGNSTILENGAIIGMSIDEIRKKHTGETPETDEDGYIEYLYKLGTEEYDHEYILEYAYDSDTKKIWKVHMDITMPTNKLGDALYKDIVANFDAKYGKGKRTADKDWEEYLWTAEIGGQKTEVTTQRMIDSEAGYILIYFEEPYE